MNRFYFLAITLFWVTLTKGQDREAFSLAEAIAYAQSHHSSLKKAALDIAAAKAQVRETTAIGLPQLSAGVDYNYYVHIPTQLIPNDAFYIDLPPPIGPLPKPEPGYSATQFGTRNNLTFALNLSMLVFDGSYLVGLQASKGVVDLTRKNADLTKYQLKDAVVKAYLTVLIAEENKSVLASNISNLEQLITETKAFYKNGLVEKLDVERLELSLANLLTEQTALLRQVDLAYNVLKFQMQYPRDKEIKMTEELEAILSTPEEGDLEGDISLSSRIETDILNQNIALNKLNVKRYKMSYLPSLSAFATHQQVLQRDDLFDGNSPGFYPTTILGLSLNVPIFDGFHKAAKIQQSKIDVQKIELQLADFERAATLQVVNARAIYQNAKSRLASQDNNLALAKKILETTKIKYKEGVGSSLEMTQAEQELYRTQANRINALYDLVIAKTDLDKALGK